MKRLLPVVALAVGLAVGWAGGRSRSAAAHPDGRPPAGRLVVNYPTPGGSTQRATVRLRVLAPHSVPTDGGFAVVAPEMWVVTGAGRTDYAVPED